MEVIKGREALFSFKQATYNFRSFQQGITLMFNIIKRLFKKNKTEAQYIDNDTQRIIDSGNRIVEIINESLIISNDSKNLDTKISRIRVVKDNLNSLKELTTNYSFFTITQLDKLEKNIVEIENDIEDLKLKNRLNELYEPNESIIDQSIKVAKANSDICDGVRFNANLDYTTPLKYLELDQCVKTDEEAESINIPSKYGHWMPKVKDIYSINISSTCATKFGPVSKEKEKNWVLQSLIKFRQVMEQPFQDATNLKELHSRSIEIVAAAPEVWVSVPHCLHFLFKEFAIDLKHITPEMLIQLLEMGFTSLHELKKATEKDFQKLNKIGPKKAKEIVEQLQA